MERRELFTLIERVKEAAKKEAIAEYQLDVLSGQLFTELDKTYPIEANKSES